MRWLKNRKRARVAKRPLSAARRKILATLQFYTKFDDHARREFHERLNIFLAEKKFVSIRGAKVTDEVRVKIAAHAVRLILRLDISLYDRIEEILIYPGDYLHPESDEGFVGEVHEWGVVVLSLEGIVDAAANPHQGFNPIYHEFAHVIDRCDGAFDGTPPLSSRKEYQEWARVFRTHFTRLAEGRKPEIEVLDEYGAETEAEFFAVATETFFENPRELRDRLPKLYEHLSAFYKQDLNGKNRND